VVSGIAFLFHAGDEEAALRLTIPPLIPFLPGVLLTMATIDLAMGEVVTGASRFVAGLIQLALLAIAILIGAELVGHLHVQPLAGTTNQLLGSWAQWLGVAVFGVAIYVHQSAPTRSMPWLLVVLFSAWIGQLAGERLIDARLSGFVGAAVMVPVAHLAARARTAPPPNVMLVPGFWLLVPGAIGLLGVTEAVGKHSPSNQELVAALLAIPSVAFGILAGTIVVQTARAAGESRRT
jgi:uncharacterized membrane protein YjjB (DUF3815 family)